MANGSKRKTSKSSKRSQPHGLATWQKRLIAAIVALLALLVLISLLFGLESIQNDKDYLSLRGNLFSWPFQRNVQVDNPIGVFGVAVGFAVSYLFGYHFSLIGAILVCCVSFLYFLDPQAPRNRQKFYLLLIGAFLVQVWMARLLI